jgi:hypothetical protein
MVVADKPFGKYAHPEVERERNLVVKLSFHLIPLSVQYILDPTIFADTTPASTENADGALKSRLSWE